MQATATAAKPPKSTTRPRAETLPALMPLPSIEKPAGIFWAVAALNEDAELQAIEGMALHLCRKADLANLTGNAAHTRRIALIAARGRAETERNLYFEKCRRAGGLLYAWRGSRALLQTLPASLRGAA